MSKNTFHPPAPLSDAAERDLKYSRFMGPGGMALSALVAAVTTFLFSMIIVTMKEIEPLSFISFTLIVLSIFSLIVGAGKWIDRRSRTRITKENEEDYYLALFLEDALKRYQESPLVSHITHPPVHAGTRKEWKPFAVDMKIADVVRGSTQTKMTLSSLLGSGEVGSEFTAVSIPDIANVSSLLYLTDEQDELLVFIPSPGATLELLTQMTRQAGVQAGVMTHTHGLISNYILSESQRGELDHLDIVLSIKRMCEERVAIENRPSIEVVGVPVGANAVFATSITVDGDERMLVPVSFLKALAHDVSNVIHRRIDVPNLLSPEPIGITIPDEEQFDPHLASRTRSQTR